jgi:hypothetical protein
MSPTVKPGDLNVADAQSPLSLGKRGQGEDSFTQLGPSATTPKLSLLPFRRREARKNETQR